MPQYR